MLKNNFEMEPWIKSKIKTTQFGDMCGVWNGAVQIEFIIKVICSDFASRSKHWRNKAELFILLNISFIVSSNMILLKWDRVQKDEIFDSRAITRVIDLTTYN